MLVESKLDPKAAVVNEICAAGEPWMKDIRKGQVFRILDLEGNQAVDTLFYNAHDPEERYNAIDTIQRQRNLYLCFGTELEAALALHGVDRAVAFLEIGR